MHSKVLHSLYRAGVQDAPQEMERNKAAAKQSKVRPTTQLLITFPPLPVGHPAHEHDTRISCFVSLLC